ncbi:hypothetical protein PGT21_011573 [Puccinia graminis f. sp. tritici]|uniref:Uncharacterized protein n=1 Tax=Puccinia graminis f. sp. tritici TaxID=56615 RepID=A0A5B0PPU9_PUCGR|nr:hypothetical protein PGT21_011573 [Puccinia graminis f. sp. tritici]
MTQSWPLRAALRILRGCHSSREPLSLHHSNPFSARCRRYQTHQHLMNPAAPVHRLLPTALQAINPPLVPVRPRMRYERSRLALHSTVSLATFPTSAGPPTIPLFCSSRRTVPTDSAGSY